MGALQSVEHLISVSKKLKQIPGRAVSFIQSYRASYTKGVEKFGIWWTIFQLSLWSVSLIFLLTAAIILVVYLPQAEMLVWDIL